MAPNQNKKRVNFASIKNPLQFPDFLEVQLKSFQDFFQLDTPPERRKKEGLYKVFAENFPIADTRNNFVLEFLDYYVDPPKYSIEECLSRGLTYSVPLKAKLKLYCTDPDHEDFATVIQDVFLGPIPYMTNSGTFVINGAERVIVSQLHRSPGVFFGTSMHTSRTQLYSARIIPFRGSWIEFATDVNNAMYAYIDRKKKLPVTTLLRAIGYESDKDILDLFGLAEEVKVSKSTLKKYVGRKLAGRVNKTYIDDLSDEDTGEVVSIERTTVLVDRDVELTEEHIEQILEAGAKTILLHKEDKQGTDYSLIFNTLQKDPCNSEHDALYYIYRQLRNAEPADEANAREVITNLFFSDKRYDLGDVGRYRINKKLNLSIDPDTRVLTNEDIVEILKYLIELANSKAQVDDIDHLSNRRVRTVGEQLYNQFGVGLARMARTVRDRMNVRDNEVFTPEDLVNAKTLSSVVNSFFGTNALSQFMDQTNPLAEITHKRRISALGPGGISRDRAGFEVRDVHYTHYGRLCPIETPEGPNIGLISSLCVYAKINDLGFIATPYRKVDNGVVDFSEAGLQYYTAEEEEDKLVAQGNASIDEHGRFTDERIKARLESDFPVVAPNEVDLMDVAPTQIASIAASLIPFLEHDDANRALMGSNMMRQAVPLLRPEAPIVGTGIEGQLVHDSRTQVVAERSGEVVYVDANCIRIKYDWTEEESFVSFDDPVTEYKLPKFRKTNQSTTIDLRPICHKGQRVEKGDILTEGYSTQGGELALGRNVQVAYMPWKGYNYEDAVIMSERLVKDDVYTSIHVEEYETDARDTKLGPEEITREIPNVGENALRNLDARGIIRIGAEVKDGDILVGKVTPKGLTEQTPEEKLLYAIFGAKSKEVRDTSLRVPHGADGVVADVKIFKREDGAELPNGVNELVRVFIVQKRKIRVGDKMAGRHGNKGVISNILPEEDMPYLPDGTPVDVMLNPLGVPSRMNIGQVLELHLGMAAKQLGIHVATPVFDGATDEDVWSTVAEAGMAKDAKTVLYDGRTGEPFDSRVSVGVMYMIKLAHMVDDKLHARSIGPYSLVTQQPLGGKAQFGGQRFGEMEVWALEAYGAAYTLQEILTYKSDDTNGRVKTYEAIVKGENIPRPGVPESFRVLMKELQALGMDFRVMDNEDNEVDMGDIDLGDTIDFHESHNHNHNEEANETEKASKENTENGYQSLANLILSDSEEEVEEESSEETSGYQALASLLMSDTDEYEDVEDDTDEE